MKERTRGGLLMGAGFLLGTVGVKALTSATAKKCYVQGVAKGLQAKCAYENIVEQAKAQVDDIVAEANYLNLSKESASAAQDAEGVQAAPAVQDADAAVAGGAQAAPATGAPSEKGAKKASGKAAK